MQLFLLDPPDQLINPKGVDIHVQELHSQRYAVLKEKLTFEVVVLRVNM